jgi:hypothetical protein
MVWVKLKDAGKLEPQAAEGHFVGYDEESKGYRIYFPRHRLIVIERDVYFDKDAVLEIGEVVFEGEKERPMAEAETLNPTAPKENNTSVHKLQNPNPPEKTLETAPIPEEDTQSGSSNLPKPCRNSLEGLPQYDPDQYGRGKQRRTLTKPSTDETVLTVDKDMDTMEICFRDAALSVISEDQLPIEDGIWTGIR